MLRFGADARLEIVDDAFDASSFDRGGFQSGELAVFVLGRRWFRAQDLAAGCVKYWDDFLRAEGLI